MSWESGRKTDYQDETQTSKGRTYKLHLDFSLDLFKKVTGEKNSKGCFTPKYIAGKARSVHVSSRCSCDLHAGVDMALQKRIANTLATNRTVLQYHVVCAVCSKKVVLAILSQRSSAFYWSFK